MTAAGLGPRPTSPIIDATMTELDIRERLARLLDQFPADRLSVVMLLLAGLIALEAIDVWLLLRIATKVGALG